MYIELILREKIMTIVNPLILKNLPRGGNPYTAPGNSYCNSVFDMNSGCYNFEEPKKSFTEQLMDVMTGATMLVGIGQMFKGLYDMLFPSKKQNNTNNNSANPANPAVQATETEKTALEQAMDAADKTGDWNPVESQVTQTEATYAQNQTEIGTCDAAISTANQIKTGAQGEIDTLKAENTDIDTNQIPQAQQKRDTAINQSQATISSLKSQISTLKATNPNADTSKLEQQIQAEEKKIQTAKDDFEKTKAQLEDKKKQNNIKIEEKQAKIKEQDGIIKTQTDKKSQLTKANQQLQKIITEAKSKLDLHLGKLSTEK
jgi:chromosome segregation ATPase